MTKEERIRGYIGLAARAGRIESGEFSTEKAVKSGKAHVVFIAGDASENTRKKFFNMCEYYKVPVFDAEVIAQVRALCEEYDVEFELISKLIVEIEANKNYTRSTMDTKAFDKIINQGWLHFESIEKGLNNEN
jgi:ribosomal protein L7Ae-like RNA K-turn-binding protein